MTYDEQKGYEAFNRGVVIDLDRVSPAYRRGYIKAQADAQNAADAKAASEEAARRAARTMGGL